MPTVDLNGMRASVETVIDLIHLLYPDVSPDILTADDVAFRYRLTGGLGAPAMQAVARAQRVVRATGNYEQIGLCEFHIGLIYFYWGRCAAARERFVEARYSWQFGKETAPICLTYFAEGQAHQHDNEFELAMAKYSKTANCLPRTHLIIATEAQGRFVNRLTEAVDDARRLLRERLWPPEPLETEQQPPPAAETEPASNGAENVTPEETAVPPPQHNLPPKEDFTTQQNTQAKEKANTNQPKREAAPYQTFNDLPEESTPIPGHNKTDKQHTWYQVEQTSPDAEALGITPESWLLVKTDLKTHQFERDELIVIFMKDSESGGIRLKSFSSTHPPFRRIHLARPTFTGPFTRNSETKIVTLSTEQKQVTIQPDNIWGVVIGFWQSLSGV